MSPDLSRRAYSVLSSAASWEEIWEAGPYYQRVSEILEDAHHYAIFAGWQIDSRLPMPRPARPGAPALPSHRETLKEKVLRLCEAKPGFQFYFLMWDHAYFYVLERQTWQGRIWEDLHPRVHFIFDNRHPFGASHHEKICIIDGRVAFVGGIDLCDERWDSPQHLYLDPRRSLDWQREHHGPYHDLAVQVSGPVCAEIQNHVAERWHALSSIPFPGPPEPYPIAPGAAGHHVYLSRTQASVDATDRRPIVREVEFAFRDLVRAARRRIVLEGQYFWSDEVCDLLSAKATEMRGQDFEIVLVLAELRRIRSLTRLMTPYELTLLERLREAADRSGIRLVLGSPYVLPPLPNRGFAPPKPVYIHSKIAVVDDRYVSIGTANFASRALRIDTEINLTLEARTEAERAHVRRLSREILRHWGLAGAPEPGPARVYLRPILPRLRLSARARAPLGHAPWGTRIPYQELFDPPLPWFYLLKRGFRKLSRRRVALARLSVALTWAVGAALAATLAGAWKPSGPAGPWPLLYSLLLGSAWLIPVPFTLTSVYASIQLKDQLGDEAGARVAVAAFWVCALIGYFLARAFPTPVARYYRRTAPLWLPARLGLRSFPTLVSVLADPRVSLRSKVAYQGLYCVPLPWFALGTGLVLPAALYLLCRESAAIAPDGWSLAAREWSGRFFAGMLAWNFAKFSLRVWKSAA